MRGVARRRSAELNRVHRQTAMFRTSRHVVGLHSLGQNASVSGFLTPWAAAVTRYAVARMELDGEGLDILLSLPVAFDFLAPWIVTFDVLAPGTVTLDLLALVTVTFDVLATGTVMSVVLVPKTVTLDLLVVVTVTFDVLVPGAVT